MLLARLQTLRICLEDVLRGSLTRSNPPPQEAYSHLDILFQGALQSKKEAQESAYAQDDA
jgi:hypothetical protein